MLLVLPKVARKWSICCYSVGTVDAGGAGSCMEQVEHAHALVQGEPEGVTGVLVD